jgi:transposase
MKSIFYVGMDVHKDSVRVAVLKGTGKETVYEATVKNDIPRIVKIVSGYRTKGKVIAGYEAGCMGYTLQRSLAEAKVECRVIAPNKVARLGSERIKTDARDAILIARMLKNDEGESIHVPTATDEATRDLLRCREDIRLQAHRTKQQLVKYLLRTGHIYEAKRKLWTKAHRDWMTKIEFDSAVQKETFSQYWCALQDIETRLERIEAKVVELAESEAYRERVARLRCFKGIDYITALALVCEVGDYRRFGCAASFMAYLGLVPSERSSGPKRRQGGITKTGNIHLRRLLIESSWHYRYRASASAALQARRAGVDEQVIAYADKALTRLQVKFSHLLYKGKSSKTAVTATARELAGFVWGTMVGIYC